MVFTRGYDRLVNLSDAVIAIAVTLLILPLVDDVTQLGAQPTTEFLVEQIGPIFLFVLSFAVVARFWLIHHQIYRNIDGYTIPLVWVNFAWLLSIAFLPFPTELLGHGNTVDQASAALYIGTMLVTSATGLLQIYLIVRRPELQLEAVRGTLRVMPAIVGTSTMALAFVIALLVPGAGVWPLLLLLVTGRAEALITRARARHASAAPDAP